MATKTSTTKYLINIIECGVLIGRVRERERRRERERERERERGREEGRGREREMNQLKAVPVLAN